MAALRAAIVGTGFIATKKHLPAFARIKDRCDLVAIVDVDEDAGRAAAAAFGIPHSYTDVGEMLEREQPDLVDICTPPRTHAPIALQAIEAGANVMIEKPMATSVQDCDAVIAAAGERGVQIAVGHSDLFYPPFIRARDLVRKGAIGTFTGMSIFLSTPVDYMTSREDHWAHKLPGGVIGESGPHVVYLTLAFINPIADVHALGTKLSPEYPWSRFEDYRLQLRGQQGVSSITSVYTTNEWAGEVEIWGTEGIIKLDLELMSLIKPGRKDLGRMTVAASGLKESVTLVADLGRTAVSVATKRYRNTHDHLIGGFVDSLLRGTPPPVTGQEGREAVRVMDEIAAQLGG